MNIKEINKKLLEAITEAYGGPAEKVTGVDEALASFYDENYNINNYPFLYDILEIDLGLYYLGAGIDRHTEETRLRKFLPFITKLQENFWESAETFMDNLGIYSYFMEMDSLHEHAEFTWIEDDSIMQFPELVSTLSEKLNNSNKLNDALNKEVSNLVAAMRKLNCPETTIKITEKRFNSAGQNLIEVVAETSKQFEKIERMYK